MALTVALPEEALDTGCADTVTGARLSTRGPAYNKGGQTGCESTSPRRIAVLSLSLPACAHTKAHAAPHTLHPAHSTPQHTPHPNTPYTHTPHTPKPSPHTHADIHADTHVKRTHHCDASPRQHSPTLLASPRVCGSLRAVSWGVPSRDRARSLAPWSATRLLSRMPDAAAAAAAAKAALASSARAAVSRITVSSRWMAWCVCVGGGGRGAEHVNTDRRNALVVVMA
jgi:hypothetical protein